MRFSLIFSLLIPALSLLRSPELLTVLLQPDVERSPTDADSSRSLHPAASVLALTPENFRRRDARLVSYYALFKWWLLLSQHPSCLSTPTSFMT